MRQKENKEQLLRLHNIITGSHQTLEQITGEWDVAPDFSFARRGESTGKVVSIEDYYPLVEPFDVCSEAVL